MSWSPKPALTRGWLSFKQQGDQHHTCFMWAGPSVCNIGQVDGGTEMCLASQAPSGLCGTQWPLWHPGLQQHWGRKGPAPSGVPAELCMASTDCLGHWADSPSCLGETHCWHSGKDTEGILAGTYQPKDSNSLKEFWEFRALKIKCRTMLRLVRKIAITENTDWPWHKTKKEANRSEKGKYLLCKQVQHSAPEGGTWRTRYKSYVAEIHTGSFPLLNIRPFLQKTFWAP